MRPLLEVEPLIELVVAEHPDGSPLDHVANAVLISDDLTDLADDLIGHFVDRARESGASWAEVGERIGVSKQAAQKRYVESPRPRRKKRRGRFARFTRGARQIVIVAHAEAHDRGGRQIRTEHLLLALIADEEAPAALAIVAGGATKEQILEAVDYSLGPAGTATKDHIPFAPESKKVLELALREAIRTKEGGIGPEHILLGMLRDETSGGAKVLTGLGVTRSGVEKYLAGG